MKLRVGKYTNKELAEWFGISEGSFKNKKDEKLAELVDYAAFEIDRGKINITEVYVDEYVKKTSPTYKCYKDNFNVVWKPGELNTCKRASSQLQAIFPIGIADSTAYDITRRVRTELYGRPFKESGTRGSCSYVWCKKDESGAPVPFTEEENRIKEDLLKKYFGTASEKSAIVQAMILKGEIQPEEAWGIYEELMGMSGEHFMSFLGEFQAAIGKVVVRATLLEKRVGTAFMED